MEQCLWNMESSFPAVLVWRQFFPSRTRSPSSSKPTHVEFPKTCPCPTLTPHPKEGLIETNYENEVSPKIHQTYTT